MSDSVSQILERINTLENELSNTNSLLREVLSSLVRSESIRQTQTLTPTTTMKPYFKIYLNKNEDNIILTFEVGGKTYDIRSDLRDLGAKEFDNNKKVWIFEYDEETYNRVLEYLKQLTDDVKIIQ